MSGASLDSTLGPQSDRRLSRRLMALIAVGVAIAVVLAGSILVQRGPSPTWSFSRHADFRAHGRATLEIPIMTMYTAPPLANATVDSHVAWSIASNRSGPSTTSLMSWSALSKGDLPVRFILNTTTPNQYVGGAPFGSFENGFLLFPAGPCTGGCESTITTEGSGTPGIRDVTFIRFGMDYDVFRVVESTGSVESTFLEIDYSLIPSCFCSTELPAANVTFPGPGDLYLIATAGLSGGSRVSVSAAGTPPPVDVFRNNGTKLDILAGQEGTVTAQLASAFRWSSVDNYVLSFSSSANVTINYLFDLRFGSLLIEYAPATP
jgi:hypothetical protein